MWYIVQKVKTDAASKQEMGARLATWSKDHENHKLAAEYAKNLKGIIGSLGDRSKFVEFIEVVSDVGGTAIYAKVSPAKHELDLSEVVKHKDSNSDSLLALFAWAVSTGKKVTLTAADGALVGIYAKYEFVGRGGAALPTGDALKAKNINFVMEMSPTGVAKYRNEYREGVFWELLPDLVGD
jgi:hypothetical protein